MFSIFRTSKVRSPEVTCSHNEIQITHSVTGAAYIKQQLELNYKVGVPKKILADGNPPTFFNWKENYPDYFYELSLKEGGENLKIFGNEKAIECAIEAMVKGGMLFARHFENAPENLFYFAEEIESQMLPPIQSYK